MKTTANMLKKATIVSSLALVVACKFDPTGGSLLSLTPVQPLPASFQNTAWSFQVGDCVVSHLFGRTQRTDIIECPGPDGSPQIGFNTYQVDSKVSFNQIVTTRPAPRGLLESSCENPPEPSGHSQHMQSRREGVALWTNTDRQSGYQNVLIYERADVESLRERLASKWVGCFEANGFVAMK